MIDWLGGVYQGRWYVEKDIASQKCMMGLDCLRSLTPEGLLCELWTGLLAYNLVRLKILQSSFIDRVSTAASQSNRRRST